MPTTISFTDTIGAATLSNGKTAPADRFSSWLPKSLPMGDAIERDSDGARIMFQTRDDWGVTFELRRIPSQTAGGVSMFEIADRLRRHLLMGGTCTVNTGDAGSRSYATCGLMPGTEPQLTQTDARAIEHTLSLALINLAGSPTQMICRYRG